ncbi:MAG: helix-turn-helix transcriptional regulator [Allomuricauda sp.]|uniref:Helix-turn-helix transcriptional regulator n=1 Tax=Flagellimonas profundi TaxID=2915620 RepID=A0ABS3FE66_9FLAO|nr:helix-turn-helix transcriptional regulator [Allomuricauda profundi]MBO0340886.1 helix-turn-helix transcriptional regulator [Allomuricauda profundi]
MNKGIVSRIETIIEHLELTVSAFADEIGVQRSSISHLLNGRNKPSLDFVMKLVDTYPQVDLYWLLKGEGSFPKEAESGNQTPEPLEKEIENQGRAPRILKEEKISEQEPYKIVLFYKDGTFRTFNTKKD